MNYPEWSPLVEGIIAALLLKERITPVISYDRQASHDDIQPSKSRSTYPLE